jgi:hypothetical protein
VRESADGIHLYALGWEELVPDILKAAGTERSVAQPLMGSDVAARMARRNS